MITLSADVFFLDGISLLLTLSRQIKFVTVEHTPSCTAKQLTMHLKCVLQVYHRAGFTVRYVLIDGEFEKVKNKIPSIVCNTTTVKENIAEDERQKRVAKKRCRGISCTVPYKYVPRRMKIEILYFVVLWINAFPVKNGISTVYSPYELIIRWKMDYKNHCRVEVGTYCEVHNEPSPSNTTEPRTHEGTALGPTRNLQGSIKFYCLNTGQVLKRRNFTPIPLPGRLIAKVEDIGNKQNPGREFRSTNRHKKLFGWTDEFQEDDNVFQGLLEPEEAAYPDIPAELPGIELERNQTEDHTDGPTNAIDDESELDF